MTSAVSIFICGVKRPPCPACPAPSRAVCSAPNCGRPLCATHVRYVDKAPRCATHAPMTSNPSMPRPPRRRPVEPT